MSTRSSSRSFLSSILGAGTLAFALIGCATDGADDDRRGPGGGGKGDSTGCPSDAEVIASVRLQLVQEAPEEYEGPEAFSGEGLVTVLGDLNGDGIDDLDVEPGIYYAGANVDHVIYMSNPDDGEGGLCPSDIAGFFAAESVRIAPDADPEEGILDIEATSHSYCEGVVTRYDFNGFDYVEESSEIFNLCEDGPTGS